MRDEGRPLGITVQAGVSNHLKVLSSKSMVSSVKEKAGYIRQMCVWKMNESEPLNPSRKAQLLSKLRGNATVGLVQWLPDY